MKLLTYDNYMVSTVLLYLVDCIAISLALSVMCIAVVLSGSFVLLLIDAGRFAHQGNCNVYSEKYFFKFRDCIMRLLI